MCGIVGYVGNRPVQEILLAGLEKLEYRGYDSAGITLQGEGGLEVVRAVGNLSHLRTAVQERAGDGSVAVLDRPATRTREAASPSRPRPRRPASATPAGPPTAG